MQPSCATETPLHSVTAWIRSSCPVKGVKISGLCQPNIGRHRIGSCIHDTVRLLSHKQSPISNHRDCRPTQTPVWRNLTSNLIIYQQLSTEKNVGANLNECRYEQWDLRARSRWVDKYCQACPGLTLADIKIQTVCFHSQHIAAFIDHQFVHDRNLSPLSHEGWKNSPQTSITIKQRL